MSYLKIDNVSAALGKSRTEVIRNLSLEMDYGEFRVIFGPSGCGKTSLLRLIAGVLSPDEGEITINDCPMNDVEPEHRGVAMAFQTFALYPHFTAYENIASPLRAANVSEEEIDRRVREVAEMLKIAHVLGQKPGQLSNGQKQRTTLGRSLIKRPRVLLLDDPLRNVDAKLRYEMRIELPELLRRFETTVIYVTQDFKEAMALGDSVAVMIDGSIRQVGSPYDVYRRPSDVETAKLFGDPPINVVPVRPQAGDGGDPRVTIGGVSMAVPHCPEALLDNDCWVGIRPEDIRFHESPRAGDVPVTLDAVMPLNVRTALRVSAPGDLRLTSSAWDVQEHSHERRDASVQVDLSHAVFFDRDRGVRVDR